MTNNIPSQRLEANFGNKNPSINVPFHKGYTSHTPSPPPRHLVISGCHFIWVSRESGHVQASYQSDSQNGNRWGLQKLLQNGCVFMSFCSLIVSGGSWLNTHSAAMFKEQLIMNWMTMNCLITWGIWLKRVNSSGRNPAVRKLRKWSEFTRMVLSIPDRPNKWFLSFDF